MIQSHYVPLQRPYRIVYTGGVMGLQIGTLIVVIDQSEAFRGRGGRDMLGAIGYMGIQTRSYPVVSYVNKDESERLPAVNDLISVGGYSEAVVWDQVEQSEVNTLCLEGQTLAWDDFLNVLSSHIGQCSSKEATTEALHKVRRFEVMLRLLGGYLGLPDMEAATDGDGTSIWTIDLDYAVFSEGEEAGDRPCICTDEFATLPFAALTEDEDEAFAILEAQRRLYLSLLSRLYRQQKNTGMCKLKILFRNVLDTDMPDYERVERMVNRLNSKGTVRRV